MGILAIALVSLFTGIFASLGLGGGMILIIYLGLFTSMDQLSAQGVNLIFFIPIALLALIMHTKNKMVEWKKITPSIIVGVIFALIFSFAASFIGSAILKKIFAAFIIIIGIRELLKKDSKRR